MFLFVFKSQIINKLQLILQGIVEIEKKNIKTFLFYLYITLNSRYKKNIFFFIYEFLKRIFIGAFEKLCGNQK